MIRIGNISKIGFSRIKTIPAAAGQVFANRKFCEKIPDKKSVNSIIDEIKKGIHKLESEMGRSIVIEEYDVIIGPETLQPTRFKQIPQKTAENAFKEPKEKKLYFAKIAYKVDEEPKQREMVIEFKQYKDGPKRIKISQNIENGDGDNFCYSEFKIIWSAEDAIRFSNAMKTLEFEWPKNYAKALRQRQDKPPMLCQQLVKDTISTEKLGIQLLPNKQLDFQMESVLTEYNYRLWKLRGPIPIEVFYWLKTQMDEIVAYYDCEEEFDQEDDEEDEDEIDSDDDE